MSGTCQKVAFTHPIVVLKSGVKKNWMKKLERVSQPLERVNFNNVFQWQRIHTKRDYLEVCSLSSDQVFL